MRWQLRAPENLTDDLRQDDLDMGVHVMDDDLVLAELLGKCHGSHHVLG